MFVFALIPPLFFILAARLLGEGFPVLGAVLFLSAGVLLALVRRRPLFLYFMLGGAFLILLGQILLIPGSAYQAWYHLLADGRPGGTISGLFAAAGGVLCFPGCLELYNKKYREGSLSVLTAGSLLFLLLVPGRLSLLILIVLLATGFIAGLPGKERNRWNIGGALILILSALLISGAPRKGGDPAGSSRVTSLSNSLRLGILKIVPDYPLLFNLPGYGYIYRTSSGGMRPVLTPSVLFSVRGNPGEVLYLRTETYSSYAGASWVIDPPEEASIPAGENPERSRIVELTVRTDFFSRLPYTGSTRQITAPDGTVYSVPPGLSALELPGKMPLAKGDTILLHQGAGAAEADDADSADLTMLPGRTEEDFRDLADLLRGPDRVSTLQNIRGYLLENCRYSLDTDRSDYPVYDFLFETRTGYCVHFASAFGILARLNGIPCRLAGGFLIRIPSVSVPSDLRPDFPAQNEPGRTSVTGYSAHRWPEVLLPGRGWTILEVTPPFAGENVFGFESADPVTQEFLQELGFSGDPAGEPDSGVAEIRSCFFRPSRRFLILTLSVLILPVLTVWILRRRFSVRLGREIRQGVRFYGRQGVASPDRTGWVSWIRSASEISPVLSIRAGQLEESLARYCYSSAGESGPWRERILDIFAEDRKHRRHRPAEWKRPADR